MNPLETLICQLERIASTNSTVFAYRIEITPLVQPATRTTAFRTAFNYEFKTFGNNLESTFLSAEGPSLVECMKNVTPEVIDNACEDWGFEMVD